MNTNQVLAFPEFSGIRCLMMPYYQGKPSSISDMYAPYREIVATVFLRKGDIGFLTIDESFVPAGDAHRGARAKYSRALHTEAGRDPSRAYYCWGGGWGRAPHRVTLNRDVRILLANNLDDSCAVWDAEHENTSIDGDIGHLAARYPYEAATLMKSGEVHEIGILTPHESIPVKAGFNRQFLRIVSSGVYGHEEYFTRNPLVEAYS